MLRIAVVGHVEHVTLGRLPALPEEGEIAHLEHPVVFPGGGGGVTFFQLTRAPIEALFFTAVGNDDGAAFVRRALERTGGQIHAAVRSAPQIRDVVIVTPSGERTIVVVGQPHHPAAADPLPYEKLADCDAVYFTATDPDLLRLCREARLLVITARRRAALIASGVRADVVVGSAQDAREASTLDDYPVRPAALVMTAGSRGGYVSTETETTPFAPTPVASRAGGAYGAGDSFAGALVYFLAAGMSPHEAASAAAAYGAAVLAALSPLEAQRPLP